MDDEKQVNISHIQKNSQTLEQNTSEIQQRIQIISLENSPTLMVEAANAIYASNAEPVSELITS